MLEIVKKDYAEYLDLHKAELPDGLYNSLRAHERMPKFFENLAKELTVIDKRIKKVDRLTIKNIVYDMTAFFITMVKQKADEANMSQAEKTAALNKAKTTITEDEAKEYTKELIANKVLLGGEVQRLAAINREKKKAESALYMKSMAHRKK